jgi:hypothetical protein
MHIVLLEESTHGGDRKVPLRGGWKQIPKNQSICARDKQQRDKKESTDFDLAKPMVKRMALYQ